MIDLLALAIEAHGGLDRWNQFSKVQAQLAIDGAIWEFKGVPGLLLDKTFEAALGRQHLTITPFGGETCHLDYTPERLAIVAPGGEVVASRDDPEAAFEGQTPQMQWDQLHAAFFAAEALWTYLNLPFLYSYPGFEVEEIEPLKEDGEVWRSLKATFPEDVTSHTRTQITRFGADGLMRRHDYTVDILGGATGLNYTTEYADFQGIKMPTKRRIYAYDDAMQKVPEPLLVRIDFKSYSFT